MDDSIIPIIISITYIAIIITIVKAIIDSKKRRSLEREIEVKLNLIKSMNISDDEKDKLIRDLYKKLDN